MIKNRYDVEVIPVFQSERHADAYEIDKDDFEQLKALALALLDSTQPEEVSIPIALAKALADGPDSLAVWNLRGLLSARCLPQESK